VIEEAPLVPFHDVTFNQQNLQPFQRCLNYEQCDSDTNRSTYCSRVLLHKLIAPQPAKKFPEFNGTQRFIIIFARSHPAPFPQPRNFTARFKLYSFKIHFNIILPYMLKSSRQSPSSRFPHQNPTLLFYALAATCTIHCIFDFSTLMTSRLEHIL